MNISHFLITAPIVLVMVSINGLVNLNRSYSLPQPDVEISANQAVMSHSMNGDCHYRNCALQD
jgi:hypothetical protein